MAQSFQLTTNILPLSDNRIITVIGLPSFISDINTLSSDEWFGQFGKITSINIDFINNWVNIRFMTETAAVDAKSWTNSSNGEFNELIDIYKYKPQQINNDSKPFELQIKQFQSQIQLFLNTKKTLNERYKIIQMLNHNQTLKIKRMEMNFDIKIRDKDKEIKNLKERMDTNFDIKIRDKNNEIKNLKGRMIRLDRKYTNIFKKLVNKAAHIENINKLNVNERFSTLLNLKKNKMIKYELNEIYNDLTQINDYIIQLETKLNLNKDCETYFKTWDICDVYRWIITIKNKRFSKYKNDLIKKLKKYNIYGIKLEWLNESDLINIGFNRIDTILLLSQIARITTKYRQVNDINHAQKDANLI